MHISHLNHDEGLIFGGLLRVSVDTGYLDWLLEEGAHVAEVSLVHLLQEAALLLLWSVAYQPLQHHSWSAMLAVLTFPVTITSNGSGRTCLMSKSTVDVLFGGELRDKVTRSFFWSTTADWLTGMPFWPGAVIRTICQQKQKHALVNPGEGPAASDAFTWESILGVPKCPFRLMAIMTRSRETERDTQKALPGRWDVTVAAGPSSWKDVFPCTRNRGSLSGAISKGWHTHTAATSACPAGCSDWARLPCTLAPPSARLNVSSTSPSCVCRRLLTQGCSWICGHDRRCWLRLEVRLASLSLSLQTSSFPLPPPPHDTKLHFQHCHPVISFNSPPETNVALLIKINFSCSVHLFFFCKHMKWIGLFPQQRQWTKGWSRRSLESCLRQGRDDTQASDYSGTQTMTSQGDFKHMAELLLFEKGRCWSSEENYLLGITSWLSVVLSTQKEWQDFWRQMTQ